MKTRPSLLLFPSAALIFWLCAAAAVTSQAQTVITSLPYTITAGGSYVLNSNLSSSQTSGNLITINASNVTLDFQNHYIAGAVGNSSQTAIGIYANERSNLTIQNGTVAYCNTGIYITGNGSATTNNVDQQINNLRVTYCYSIGIYVQAAPSSRITNCQVSQIGFSASTTVPGGIVVVGAGVTVQSNSVSNVTASSGVTSYCIQADTGSFVRQNQVSTATYGVMSGIYQDNLAHACTTAFSNGLDAGGNFHD